MSGATESYDYPETSSASDFITTSEYWQETTTEIPTTENSQNFVETTINILFNLSTRSDNESNHLLPTLGRLEFSWFDHTLFGLMLGLSALIGVYFAFFGKTKQDNTKEYLLGGKEMGTFPIAMSLVASHVSGITLLGVPSEVYSHGTAYLQICISIILVAFIVCGIYLPVFYKLQLTSTYEYLERRFCIYSRKTASFIFALSMIFYIPIVIYIPALAFSAVTGISIHLITPITCFVCIFYTTLGGLKAVVWTDTLQIICMIGSLFAVLFLGTSAAGGFKEVWQKSIEGERLDYFNMNLDPTLRASFWSVVVGGVFAWTSYVGVNQGCVQRFLAVPTIKQARHAMILMAVGIVIIKIISVFTGQIMYSKYAGCDPITLGVVKRSDQLLPYYVIDVAGHIPGLPGLFVAGVFSAALSTMSATLNTLAGTTYEDFIKPLMPKNTTEKTASDIMKGLVVISGTICVILVFIVEKLGGVLHLGISLSGITAGPLLGIFSIGLFFPMANTKGAMCGALSAVAIMIWIVFGAQMNLLNGTIVHVPKPLTIDQCDFDTSIYTNSTTPATQAPAPAEEAFFLYRVSNYYYSFIGMIVTLLIGLPISWMTGGRNQIVDRDLLSPIAKIFMGPPKKTDYTTVATALKIVEMGNEKDFSK